MEVIKQSFPELTDLQIELFAQLPELYADWNSKINVISRKDMDAFNTRHVLHSLAIVKLTSLKGEKKVLDIGTGGGFPGIPLAIYYPEIQFTLVDSIGKKIKVVQAVADALDLKNVKAINDRAENIRNGFDSIVSRAVAPAAKLVHWTLRSLNKNGRFIFIKGGDLLAERDEIWSDHPKANWQEFAIKNVFEDDFFETKKIIELSGLKA